MDFLQRDCKKKKTKTKNKNMEAWHIFFVCFGFLFGHFLSHAPAIELTLIIPAANLNNFRHFPRGHPLTNFLQSTAPPPPQPTDPRLRWQQINRSNNSPSTDHRHLQTEADMAPNQ